ncbi:hypothetical protein B0H13DRAFT_1195183 [Mycena leptocephala]|nr:hypothetical protein B0H13DRAFT_1195183 [Mycena leptocephala]
MSLSWLYCELERWFLILSKCAACVLLLHLMVIIMFFLEFQEPLSASEIRVDSFRKIMSIPLAIFTLRPRHVFVAVRRVCRSCTNYLVVLALYMALFVLNAAIFLVMLNPSRILSRSWPRSLAQRMGYLQVARNRCHVALVKLDWTSPTSWLTVQPQSLFPRTYLYLEHAARATGKLPEFMMTRAYHEVAESTRFTVVDLLIHALLHKETLVEV